LSCYHIVRLCAKYRVARMLEREDFRKRLSEQQPVSVHEFLYPLLVAYDSVVLEADVELGATEQKFNLLIGREIQREYNQELQIAVMMPILVGLDGQRKMSKSLGNYVGITEPPVEMFGKMMSIPDELMWSYYELVTDRTSGEISELRKEVTNGSLHPMDAKMRLAEEVVSDFHGMDAGRKAAENFQRVFRDRQAPEEMTEIRLLRTGGALVGTVVKDGAMVEQLITAKKWSQVLTYLGQIASAAEAERLIKQGGFEIDGQLVTDATAKLNLDQAATYKVRIGKKKFVRLVVE
jgi:tyrosyl-tRNA synthetase